MSNKKTGNDFEQEFCRILAGNGFWVHNFANRANGQPADIIAVKNDCAYLIDCKVCEHDVFELRRIEENQRYAMQKWLDAGNSVPLFALKTSKGIYLETFTGMQFEERRGVKSYHMYYMQKIGCTLEYWLTLAGKEVEDYENDVQ